MSFLLDTNVCVAYLNGSDAALRDRLLAARPDEVHLCSVVKAELLYGARNSARVEENLGRLRTLFDVLMSLPFGDDAAEQYGILRTQLRREGRLIGSNDLLIAAIALAADLTLVTRNQAEFRRVPGLRLAVW